MTKIVLGVLFLFVAAVCVYLALHPGTAFQLDEGWKFKNKTEPSKAYESVSTFQFMMVALVMAGLALWAILAGVQQIIDEHRDNRARAERTRCEAYLLPRFAETMEWNGYQLKNRQRVEDLANLVGVRISISKEFDVKAGYLGANVDKVDVYDPRQPLNDGLILSYLGGDRDGNAVDPLRRGQVECYPTEKQLSR